MTRGAAAGVLHGEGMRSTTMFWCGDSVTCSDAGAVRLVD